MTIYPIPDSSPASTDLFRTHSLPSHLVSGHTLQRTATGVQLHKAAAWTCSRLAADGGRRVAISLSPPSLSLSSPDDTPPYKADL